MRNGGIMDSVMVLEMDGKKNLPALRKAEETSSFCCWNCFTKNRERLHSTGGTPVTSFSSNRAPLIVWDSKPVENLITAQNRAAEKAISLMFFLNRCLYCLYQLSADMLRKSPEYQRNLNTPITANYDEIKVIISRVWDDTKVKACSIETNNSNDSHECSIMQPGKRS